MKFTLLAAAAILGLASSSNAANLVINGDFTQLSNGLGQFDTNTTVTGWSGNGGYDFVFNTADQPVQGFYGALALWDKANKQAGDVNDWNGKTASGQGNFAAMDGDFDVSPIRQIVTGLRVGRNYTLNFNYAFGQQQGFDGPTIQSLDANIGSVTWNSGDFNVANHGFTGWNTEHLSFTANATSETLSFLAHGNLPIPPFALVSTVSIPGVPEPGTWSLMILGVGAMGGMARRRRMAGVAA